MTGLNKYRYELIIEDYEQPSIDTILDIANIIHNEIMCESIEVNKIDD